MASSCSVAKSSAQSSDPPQQSPVGFRRKARAYSGRPNGVPSTFTPCSEGRSSGFPRHTIASGSTSRAAAVSARPIWEPLRPRLQSWVLSEPAGEQRERRQHVGARRFHCFEIWFLPSFIGKEACGINNTSFQYIMKCDVYIRKDLNDNVVLSSGTTIFQGMFQRMTNELKALAPTTRISILSTSCQTE